MNQQEPRHAQPPNRNKPGHGARYGRQPHDWRQAPQTGDYWQNIDANSTENEEEWFEGSSRILPPVDDTFSFNTGAFTAVRLPTKQLPDISEQPTMMLPAITQLPTTALPIPDISQWPTQPALPRVRRTQEPLGDDEESDLESLPTWILPVITAGHPAVRTTRRQRAIFAGAEGYVALVGNLVKSSGIYALAALGAPLISLGLSPFLAHYLSKNEYGVLAVLTTIVGLAAGITQLGLGSAFFRAYNYDFSTSRDRNGVLMTTLLMLLVVSIPVALTATVSAPPLSEVLFGTARYGTLLSLAAYVVLAQNLAVPGLAWLRADNRPLFYSALSIGNSLITLFANIVLVGILREGVAGSLIATGLGYALIAIVTLPLIIARSGFNFRFDIARNLLSFGVPMILNVVSFWVLQLSDRYLLSLLRSLNEAGSYTVAYTLGSSVNVVVVAPFILAWPTTMYTIAKRKDAPQVFRLVFRWLGMVLLLAAYTLSLVGKLAIAVLFPQSYLSAIPVIPVVAESLVFYGLYYVLMVGVNIQRKTWMAAVFMLIAATVNVGLNLYLIPKYGGIGAAYSTLFAYIILAALAYMANQRIYPVPYEIMRFVIAFGGGVAVFIWSDTLVRAIGSQWTWQIDILGLVVYSGWLLLLGTFGRVSQLGAVARLARRA